MLILVEGNIGVGKSTFLQTIKEIKGNINIIPEPVKTWEDVGILDAFYSDQKRWAYTFQSIAFATRVSAVLTGVKPDKTNIIERSVFIDKHGFAKYNHELGNMNDMEWNAYSIWYNLMLEKFETDLTPDKIIYLQASPSTCLERIKKRSRTAEVDVDIDYLQGLHEKYEEWVAMDDVRDKVTTVCIDENLNDDEYKLFMSELLEKIGI